MALPRAPDDAFKRGYFLLALAMCAWWQAAWELDAQYTFFLMLIPMLVLPLLVTALVFVTGFLIDIFARHWRGAASAVVACGLTFSFCWWVPHDQHWCNAEVVDSLALPSSDWVVETTGWLCGFGISAGQNIRAHNIRTGEMIVIATGDLVFDTTLSNDWPNHVTIRLDNKTDVVQVNSAFDGVQVDFDYLPRDDPEERAAWRRWSRHPEAPENRAWYCNTQMRKGPDYDNRNRWLTSDYSPKDPPYCK